MERPPTQIIKTKNIPKKTEKWKGNKAETWKKQ